MGEWLQEHTDIRDAFVKRHALDLPFCRETVSRLQAAVDAVGRPHPVPKLSQRKLERLAREAAAAAAKERQEHEANHLAELDCAPAMASSGERAQSGLVRFLKTVAEGPDGSSEGQLGDQAADVSGSTRGPTADAVHHAGVRADASGDCFKAACGEEMFVSGGGGARARTGNGGHGAAGGRGAVRSVSVVERTRGGLCLDAPSSASVSTGFPREGESIERLAPHAGGVWQAPGAPDHCSRPDNRSPPSESAPAGLLVLSANEVTRPAKQARVDYLSASCHEGSV